MQMGDLLHGYCPLMDVIATLMETFKNQVPQILFRFRFLTFFYEGIPAYLYYFLQILN